MKRTVIIGAGAAGLMAAYSAAVSDSTREILIIEKNARPARKVMITGKGRCNVTNSCDNDTLIKNTVTNPRFLYSAFSAFSASDTVDFFEQNGVPLKTERGNRVFPVSDKAVDIVDALVGAVKKCGVKIINGIVSEITAENGVATGVILQSGEKISAESVLLATGGMSYPLTGSTGDGYKVAAELGHTINTPTASLVPIVCHEGFCSRLSGLSLKNVTLTVFEQGRKKPIFSEMGEMLFTHFGISGPLVLSASAHMKKMGEVTYKIYIDLKPALSEQQLDNRLLRDFSELQNKAFRNSLDKLLPKSLIPTVVALSGIDPECRVNSITREDRKALAELLKAFPLTPRELRPIEEAIITRGGASVKEINPATMESKLIKGLFFAGEIVDVDALTGGFNLQIAFSTGYLAGKYL